LSLRERFQRLRDTAPEAFAGARAAAPKVAVRVLLVLALLQVGYLLIANVLIATPLLRKIVNPAEAVELEYDWAYSPWPGRIHVKNLALRFEDYNIEFQVAVERGALDVRIDELVSRRFHAVKMTAEGTSFRMRHKLHGVGKDARRAAAYPPIPGLADPPLYRGTPPPPVPDSEYALWDVRFDDIDARVREVWVLEYRYRGDGRAWGSFHVLPARWYEVDAGLKLERGTLRVAGVAAAEEANLEVLCRVLGTDPRAAPGLEPLRTIFATMKGTLARADLAFLNVYLEPFLGVSASGGADIRLGVGMDAGVLREGTRVQIETRKASIQSQRLGVHGEPRIELTVKGAGEKGHVGIEALAGRLQASGPAEGVEPPFVEKLRAHLELTRDLTRPMRILSAGVAIPNARAPELAWFEPLFAEPGPKLRGKASAELELEHDGKSAARGEVSANVSALVVAVPSLDLRGYFDLKSRFDSPPGGKGGVALRGLSFRGDGVSLSTGGERTPAFGATITSNDVSITSFEPPSASGTLDVQMTRTEQLLPLAVGSEVLRDLMVAGLGLRTLTGRALFDVDAKRSRVEVREARSGAVTARGFLEQRSGSEPDARFLFTTNLANIGVRIDRGETSVKPLVADDWLTKSAFVLPRRAE
jgi:hypothetical protein